jgi:hypothetical protein
MEPALVSPSARSRGRAREGPGGERPVPDRLVGSCNFIPPGLRGGGRRPRPRLLEELLPVVPAVDVQIAHLAGRGARPTPRWRCSLRRSPRATRAPRGHGERRILDPLVLREDPPPVALELPAEHPAPVDIDREHPADPARAAGGLLPRGAESLCRHLERQLLELRRPSAGPAPPGTRSRLARCRPPRTCASACRRPRRSHGRRRPRAGPAASSAGSPAARPARTVAERNLEVARAGSTTRAIVAERDEHRRVCYLGER